MFYLRIHRYLSHKKIWADSSCFIIQATKCTSNQDFEFYWLLHLQKLEDFQYLTILSVKIYVGKKFAMFWTLSPTKCTSMEPIISTNCIQLH